MSNLAYVVLAHDAARTRAAELCRALPIGTVARFAEPTRNLEQNAKMWAMLHDISEQVQWSVDGRLQLLPAEDWKTILTAGQASAQRVAQGVEGGFVMLGRPTSKMSVREMRELIEFAQFFGDSRGVRWSRKACE